MSEKSYRAWITVTDAGAQDGSQSRVTDLGTGQSIVVDNQADTVAEAIAELNRNGE